MPGVGGGVAANAVDGILRHGEIGILSLERRDDRARVFVEGNLSVGELEPGDGLLRGLRGEALAGV